MSPLVPGLYCSTVVRSGSGPYVPRRTGHLPQSGPSGCFPVLIGSGQYRPLLAHTSSAGPQIYAGGKQMSFICILFSNNVLYQK